MKKWLIISLVIVLVVAVTFYFSGEGAVSIFAGCAGLGEEFSSVFVDDYPAVCCDGLMEWESGMDTSISIGGECYGTMMLSGNPVGTCIPCGDGVCDDMEDVCSCPDDCKDGKNSRYATVEEFCEEMVGSSLLRSCEEDWFVGIERPICQLC